MSHDSSFGFVTILIFCMVYSQYFDGIMVQDISLAITRFMCLFYYKVLLVINYSHVMMLLEELNCEVFK